MRTNAGSLHILFAAFLILPLTAPIAGAAPMAKATERKVTQLADGVYAIEHSDAHDGFMSGNTTVVIGDRQVLVVDTGFLPSVSREDIAQIRQWTEKPVSFVFNTHFHNDHNLGNRAYMDAFPAVTVISQVETKRNMDTFGPTSAMREERGNRYMREMLETGKTPEGQTLSAEDKSEVKDTLALRLPRMPELNKIKFQSATLTFDHELNLDLGNREVQLKFLGRGNTGGDAIAYLPKENILITGDLVVYPIPMA